MAALAGKSGAVKLSTNTVTEIGDWTLDIAIDTAEATDFGDSWKEHIYTLRGASGSFKCRFDKADTNGHVALQTEALSGTSGVSLRLYIDGTNYYSGTALITSMSPSASVGGLVEVTYNFVIDGTLAYN